MDAKRIICGACILLKSVTANDDAFGSLVAAATCGICGSMFVKEAVDYAVQFQRIKEASKKTCKAINAAAAKGEEYFKNS